jgi:hypothetical protein
MELNIKPFKYKVKAYDGSFYLGEHLSTSTTRYEARKNMMQYIKDHGYNINEVTLTIKIIR